MPQLAFMPRAIRHIPKALVLLFVALLFACGSSSDTAEDAQPKSAPAAAPATQAPVKAKAPSSQPTKVPTPAVKATKAPPAKVKPTGTINYGVPETGIFQGHPRELSSPRVQYSAVSYGESMWAIQPDLSAGPMLATEWSISDDFLTWTIQIRDDVQFHKGYGLMTMDDVHWTYKEYHEGALLARATILGNFWLGKKGGSQEIVDDFTIKVNTGEPWVPQVAYEAMRHLGGTSTSITSKKQSEELGVEKASVDIAATGPWEIVDHESGSYWRFKAVEDHWRQTPYFDELIIHTIPEESARVAGFQTGNLDVFQMAFDSLPTVDAVEGAKIVAFPNAGQAGLNIYGQTYGVDKEGNPYPATDCTNAWVSCDEDLSSQEWANAVMVKKAMSLAIDRQTIVDELLSGFGNPIALRDWMGHEGKADPSWNFPYDPETAKQLLVDAGYPNGFSITLTPAIRGAPAETEACEAVAQYWEDIGINVNIQKVPYATIRPTLITRQYQGVTCHTVGPRLTPIIGAGNYVNQSTFSYGTEHPWLQEKVTIASKQVDPIKLAEQEREVYNWFYENVMGFGLYAFDGIWPMGPKLDPDFAPFSYSETRLPNSFEYIKHRK